MDRFIGAGLYKLLSHMIQRMGGTIVPTVRQLDDATTARKVVITRCVSGYLALSRVSVASIPQCNANAVPPRCNVVLHVVRHTGHEKAPRSETPYHATGYKRCGRTGCLHAGMQVEWLRPRFHHEEPSVSTAHCWLVCVPLRLLQSSHL